MEYKVRVKKDLKVGEHYGKGYLFNAEMQCYKGKVLTIKSINYANDCSKYYLVKENERTWVDEMLEPVEDIIEYKGKKYEVISNDTWHDMKCREHLELYLIEHKEEILDEAEKRYLKNVIKYVIEPTYNEVKNISKIERFVNDYYICFDFNNRNYIGLPPFKDKRMYKGMELGKEYTLEQLGLDK